MCVRGDNQRTRLRSPPSTPKWPYDLYRSNLHFPFLRFPEPQKLASKWGLSKSGQSLNIALPELVSAYSLSLHNVNDWCGRYFFFFPPLPLAPLPFFPAGAISAFSTAHTISRSKPSLLRVHVGRGPLMGSSTSWAPASNSRIACVDNKVARASAC